VTKELKVKIIFNRGESMALPPLGIVHLDSEFSGTVTIDLKNSISMFPKAVDHQAAQRTAFC
jgi:hypothetical protein